MTKVITNSLCFKYSNHEFNKANHIIFIRIIRAVDPFKEKSEYLIFRFVNQALPRLAKP